MFVIIQLEGHTVRRICYMLNEHNEHGFNHLILIWLYVGQAQTYPKFQQVNATLTVYMLYGRR